MARNEDARKCTQIFRRSLQDEVLPLLDTSEEEESASDEEREDFPSLVPRPELFWNV